MHLSILEETVKIDKDGVITGLKTILQTGKNYALSIKAPNSLRRNATFVAEEGTTIVTRPNDQDFILPIGDIAPTQSPDGKINTVDKAELTRQWRIFGENIKAQTGDFNRDTKVNSFDWACMRYDFNAEDDPIPTDIEQIAPISQNNSSDASTPVKLASTGGGSSSIQQTPVPLSEAYFSFIPFKSTVKKNCDHAVNIYLDTGGKFIDGVDVIIKFNPNVIADTTFFDGVLPFDKYEVNDDNTRDFITISAPTPTNKPFRGSGIFGRIVFKVKPNPPVSTLDLSFDFDPNDKGKTTDSNIVEDKTLKDILSYVVNGNYQITSGSC